MSNAQPPSGPIVDVEHGGTSYRDAKAQVKAAKAYAKAQRPWYKKKRFMIPLVLAVIVVIASVSSQGSDDATTTADSSSDTGSSATSDIQSQDKSAEEEAKEDAAAGIGDKVRDGKFQFTVTKVKTGIAQVGDDTFGQKAQGQFVFVYLKVKNIGDEPQTLFGDNQTLYIGGKKYSADTEAGIYLEESKSFIEEINPGNSIDGIVVFDVPKSATSLDKIELHDSAFSGGVEVDLSGA